MSQDFARENAQHIANTCPNTRIRDCVLHKEDGSPYHTAQTNAEFVYECWMVQDMIYTLNKEIHEAYDKLNTPTECEKEKAKRTWEKGEWEAALAHCTAGYQSQGSLRNLWEEEWTPVAEDVIGESVYDFSPINRDVIYYPGDLMEWDWMDFAFHKEVMNELDHMQSSVCYSSACHCWRDAGIITRAHEDYTGPDPVVIWPQAYENIIREEVSKCVAKLIPIVGRCSIQHRLAFEQKSDEFKWAPVERRCPNLVKQRNDKEQT